MKMEELRKKSICYMSLADAFLTRLRQDVESRTRSKMCRGLSVEVLPVTGDHTRFISNYITNIYNIKRGNFSKFKKFAKHTIYECERSNVCKGSSTGDPTKTRANGCQAYVSFKFVEGATISACVVRARLQHTGHDPACQKEARVSRLDPAIHTHIHHKASISDIMKELARKDRERGNTNHRFSPTSHHLQQLTSVLRAPHSSTPEQKKARKYNKLTKGCVSRLLKTELRESCLFYQSPTNTGNNSRPLVLVLQSPDMREMLVKFGQQVVYVDKNYEGLQLYGSAVYTLAVLSEGDSGYPAAYIITSDDTPHSFALALQKLQAKCPVSPRAFFLDHKINGLWKVMSPLYPESCLLVSWCQMLQAVHQWLKDIHLLGKETVEVQKNLMQNVLELQACQTEEDFIVSASAMRDTQDFEAFTSMLQVEWLTRGASWSNFGRAALHHYNTAQSESFFLKLHQNFLKGLHTKKSLEELLRFLTDSVVQHQHFMDEVANTSLLVADTSSDQCDVLLNQDLLEQVAWQGDWMVLIPCHSQPDSSYLVHLITMECECPAMVKTGPCMHLSLALVLAKHRHGLSLQEKRQRLAMEACKNFDYVMHQELCITFHSSSLCATNMRTGKCTCIASAFDVECVGQMVLKMVASDEGDTREVSGSPVSDRTIQRKMLSDVRETLPFVTISVSTGSGQRSAEGLLEGIQAELVTFTLTDTKFPLALPSTAMETPEEKKELNLASHKPEDSEPSILIKSRSNKWSCDKPLSTQNIIERLYHWSRSEEFMESEKLHDALEEVQQLVWGQRAQRNQHQPDRKLKVFGRRDLGIMMRPAKRRRTGEED